MKKLLSILVAVALLLGFAAIPPAAGAAMKHIYEADLVDARGTTDVSVNGQVSIDPNYVARFEIKVVQTNPAASPIGRLGVTMNVASLPGQRQNVFLGDIPIENGEGEKNFDLKDATIDYRVLSPNLNGPSFGLFSYGPPAFQEASTSWLVYEPAEPFPPPWDWEPGTIEIKTVYNFGSPAPTTWPNWFYDASWLADPVIVHPLGGPVTFGGLRPRYYAITYHTPPTGWNVVVTFSDPTGDTFPMSPPGGGIDRTLIVNLGNGEKVTVTYTYTYTPPPPPPLP